MLMPLGCDLIFNERSEYKNGSTRVGRRRDLIFFEYYELENGSTLVVNLLNYSKVSLLPLRIHFHALR